MKKEIKMLIASILFGWLQKILKDEFEISWYYNQFLLEHIDKLKESKN